MNQPDLIVAGGVLLSLLSLYAAMRFARRKRYPELRTHESFLRLQDLLVETEQRIALAREYFNEITTYYNVRLEQIPDRWIAKSLRLRPRALWEARDFERAPVEVSLAS